MEENRNYELCKVFKVDRDLQEIFNSSLRLMGFDKYGDKMIGNDKYKNEFENDLYKIKSFSYDDYDCNCGFDEKCFEIDENKNSEFMGFHSVDCCCNSAPNFWYKPKNIKIIWYKYPLRDAYSNCEISKELMKEIMLNCENSMNIKLSPKTIIEGIIENNTETYDINDGVWGIKTDNGDFIECGNLLGELDIVLNQNNYKETQRGQKIKIEIE